MKWLHSLIFEQAFHAAWQCVHQTVTTPDRLFAPDHVHVRIGTQELPDFSFEFDTRVLVDRDDVLILVVINCPEQALELVGIAMEEDQVADHALTWLATGILRHEVKWDIITSILSESRRIASSRAVRLTC